MAFTIAALMPLVAEDDHATRAAVRRVSYGPGLASDSLNNTYVGGPRNQRVSYRFRATTTSRLKGITIFIVNGKAGYSGGNGGKLRITVRSDDGSPRHRPGRRILARTNVGRPPHGAGVAYAFPSRPRLVRGRLYHIVFSNTDRAPRSNFFSVDGLFVYEEERRFQPAYTNTDWAQLVKGEGSAWSAEAGRGGGRTTPIMALRYANGKQDGVGYMEVWSPKPAIVSGSNAVREVFRVSGRARRVSSVSVRLMRVAGDGALRIRLLNARGRTIATGSVPASRVARREPSQQRGSTWVTANLGRSIRLGRGKRYRLVLSSPSDTRYSIFTIREGASYGYGPGTYFRDGHAEYRTAGAWHLFEMWGRRSREADLQFFFR